MMGLYHNAGHHNNCDSLVNVPVCGGTVDKPERKLKYSLA